MSKRYTVEPYSSSCQAPTKYRVVDPRGQIIMCLDTWADAMTRAEILNIHLDAVAKDTVTHDPNVWCKLIIQPPTRKPESWVFAPTGEVRIPRDGELFLPKSGTTHALAIRRERNEDGHAVDWMSGPVPIYRRVPVSELKCPHKSEGLRSIGAYLQEGWNGCLDKLGITP